MEDKARKKRRGAGGFSLPELMLVMLILLLVGQIAAGGIATVIKLYQRTVDIANAQTYLNTTMLALRSRLSLASDADPENTETAVMQYTDPARGYCKISNDANKGIVVEYLNVNKESRQTPEVYALLPERDGFISSYGAIEYTIKDKKAYFIITGLKVNKKGAPDSEPPAKLDSPYYIHTVNPSTG